MLSAEERPAVGAVANEVRAAIEEMIEEKKRKLESERLQHRLEGEKIDVTMPSKAA